MFAQTFSIKKRGPYTFKNHMSLLSTTPRLLFFLLDGRKQHTCGTLLINKLRFKWGENILSCVCFHVHLFICHVCMCTYIDTYLSRKRRNWYFSLLEALDSAVRVKKANIKIKICFLFNSFLFETLVLIISIE